VAQLDDVGVLTRGIWLRRRRGCGDRDQADEDGRACHRAGSGSAKANTMLPAEIATNCRSPTAKLIGDAAMFAPVCTCHKCWPVFASSATRLPSRTAPNTTFPAVA